MYVDDRIQRAKDSVLIKNSVLTKNLNVWSKNEKGWIPVSRWDSCYDESLTIEFVKDLDAYITLDLSAKLDLTNVKITFTDGDSIYPFDWFYLPTKRFSKMDNKKEESYKEQLQVWQDKGDIIKCGNESIDYSVIIGKIIELYKEFNIKAIGFDPWNSSNIIQTLQSKGVPESVFVEYTQIGFKNCNMPSREFEAKILDGKISHNGNQVMRWCLENTAIKENAYESIRPDKINQSRKIDGTITAIMAVGLILWDSGDNPKEKKLSPISQRIENSE
jgi:phage terminase large subunit-like protein